jgi:DNA-binding NarL/FixJ family response regulator
MTTIHYTRIALIEDNRYVREGWKAILESVPHFKITGAYVTCEDAFKTDVLKQTDIMLMDIGLPGMSGIDGVRYVTEHYPSCRVIMCSVYDDDQNVFDAICAGAIGYLLKKTPAEELVKSIRDAYEGGSPMTPNIARKVIASLQKAPVKSPLDLSERELSVLNLLAQGKSYTAIGNELFLSVDGVRYHIRHIYEKLQVRSRGEATAKGLKYGLLKKIS